MKTIPIQIKKHTKVRRPQSIHKVTYDGGLFWYADELTDIHFPIVHTGATKVLETTKVLANRDPQWSREMNQVKSNLAESRAGLKIGGDKLAFEILGKKLNKPSLWERIKRKVKVK